MASKNGEDKLVKVLLFNHMLDVDNHEEAECWEGWEDSKTSLGIAARYGRVEVAKLLLDRGANPNKATRQGWTPLHAAVIHWPNGPMAK